MSKEKIQTKIYESPKKRRIKEIALPVEQPKRRRRGGGGGGRSKENTLSKKPGCCNCGISIDLPLDTGTPGFPLTICTICTDDQCVVYKEEKQKEKEAKLSPFARLFRK